MKLACKIFGQGSSRGDVILIHGTGARAEMWMPQIKLLEDEGWRAIVPDLRGHGESEEPGLDTNIDSHLEDLFETFGDLQIDWPAIFVGHSLGSIISIELAARRPELVSMILAASLPGRVPKITVEAFRLFLGMPYRALKNSPIHRSLGWREKVLMDTNHHSLKQVVENFHELDYVSELPELQCPVHFVVGRLDPIAPALHVETMHKNLPGSTLKIIDWAGHNCMDSQPEEFNRWFLEKMNSK
ncbi:MAG: alpha/beta hydrolase [Candidatus Obscuribacterales bacterium]|nr:alpha/beta hydrolase [Candidatus Obscuribacterales bacterium]